MRAFAWTETANSGCGLGRFSRVCFFFRNCSLPLSSEPSKFGELGRDDDISARCSSLPPGFRPNFVVLITMRAQVIFLVIDVFFLWSALLLPSLLLLKSYHDTKRVLTAYFLPRATQVFCGYRRCCLTSSNIFSISFLGNIFWFECTFD